jgi:hypothetical protein
MWIIVLGTPPSSCVSWSVSLPVLMIRGSNVLLLLTTELVLLARSITHDSGSERMPRGDRSVKGRKNVFRVTRDWRKSVADTCEEFSSPFPATQQRLQGQRRRSEKVFGCRFHHERNHSFLFVFIAVPYYDSSKRDFVDPPTLSLALPDSSSHSNPVVLGISAAGSVRESVFVVCAPGQIRLSCNAKQPT